MNLANLISKQCSRDPSEVLTDEQAMSLWGEREVARQAAQNMALGVAAVGKLLALTSTEGEVGQETSERLGWFLEEIGGGASSSWWSSNRSSRIASTGRRRLSNEGHSGYQLPGDCAG
ncbi:hypothetical protein X922_17570 [Pseudomonas aeruginosa VRFPA08]|nr:hypothetical protein X922_17570 [Pseudomonas aeruginosa VRFPA08]